MDLSQQSLSIHHSPGLSGTTSMASEGGFEEACVDQFLHRSLKQGHPNVNRGRNTQTFIQDPCRPQDLDAWISDEDLCWIKTRSHRYRRWETIISA